LAAQRYVASGSVKAIVENATYDSDSNTIEFDVLTPVKFGESVQYPFFWPSSAPTELRFPTPAEIVELNNSGGTVASLITVDSLFDDDSYLVELPSRTESDIWVGGSNIIFPGMSDRGSRYPGDTGFASTNPAPASSFTGYTTTSKPDLDLNMKYFAKQGRTPIDGNPATPTIIDIRKTKVIDSDGNPKNVAHFDSIIKQISQSGDLLIDTEAKFTDGSNEEKFDFKFDDGGGKFGAGTAFLQDQ
jgi:hypothetical protein